MSAARGLPFAFLAALVLSLALFPGITKADPAHAGADWGDCKINVRYSIAQNQLWVWNEHYFATFRCRSEKPAAREMRMLTAGTSQNSGRFFSDHTCDLGAIKAGVKYTCLAETSVWCGGRTETRFPLARFLINNGHGFRVVANASASPASLSCRRMGFFRFGLSAVEGREVAAGSPKTRSG